jgi:Ca-activated chloride channel family protein
MRLLWPWFALLLLILPTAIGLYLWALRRKRRLAVRFSSLSILREAIPARARWRRHLPFALFLCALVNLSVAMARPVAEVRVPSNQTTIVLALDVSRSMCSTDIDPNRLSVAQQAAQEFISRLSSGTRVGIVAFSDFAQIVVPPTTDKAALSQAIESLTTSIGTAIGSATLKAIDAIAEVNPDVTPSGVDLSAGATGPLPAGYQPDIIVLLTDGANTRGPQPLAAAQQAADRRVRVYTVGFGTTHPGPMVCTTQQLGSDALAGEDFGFGRRFGGGFGGGGGFRRFQLLDEPTLQGIARLTGAAYYRAESADQLLGVFRGLPTQIVFQKQDSEVTVVFLVLAAACMVAALGLSLRWNRFP